jgi:hypothetical protein
MYWYNKRQTKLPEIWKSGNIHSTCKVSKSYQGASAGSGQIPLRSFYENEALGHPPGASILHIKELKSGEGGHRPFKI